MTVPPEQPLNDDSSIKKANTAVPQTAQETEQEREKQRKAAVPQTTQEQGQEQKQEQTAGGPGAETHTEERTAEDTDDSDVINPTGDGKSEEENKGAGEEPKKEEPKKEEPKEENLDEQDLAGTKYPERPKPEPGKMDTKDVTANRNVDSAQEAAERKQRRDQTMDEMRRYGFDEDSQNAAQAILNKREDQPNYEALMPRQALQGWGRALLSFTDNRGKRAIERLDAGTKMLGAVRRLTRAFLSPNFMSVPAAMASEAAVGFGTIYDYMDKMGELKGIKQNADRTIAFETPQGARFFRDKDRAEKANRYIIQQYNDLIQDAVGPDGDPSQIGFAQWDAIRQKMNRMLDPEMDRIERAAQRGFRPSMEDRAIIEAYKSLNKRYNTTNKDFSRRYRHIMQGKDEKDLERPEWDAIRERYEADPAKYENQLMIMNILGDEVAENFKDDNISEHYVRRAYKQLNLMKEQAKAEGDTEKLALYDKYTKRLGYLAYDIALQRPEKPNEARRREGREEVNAMRDRPMEHVSEIAVLNLLGNDAYLDFVEGKPTSNQFIRARREANARYNDAKMKGDTKGMEKWRRYISHFDRVLGEQAKAVPPATGTPAPGSVPPGNPAEVKEEAKVPAGKYDDLFRDFPTRAYTEADFDRYTTQELQEIADGYSKQGYSNLMDHTRKQAQSNRKLLNELLKRRKGQDFVRTWYGDVREGTFDLIRSALRGEDADTDLTQLTDDELVRLRESLQDVVEDANERLDAWHNGEDVYNGDLTDAIMNKRKDTLARIDGELSDRANRMAEEPDETNPKVDEQEIKAEEEQGPDVFDDNGSAIGGETDEDVIGQDANNPAEESAVTGDVTGTDTANEDLGHFRYDPNESYTYEDTGNGERDTVDDEPSDEDRSLINQWINLKNDSKKRISSNGPSMEELKQINNVLRYRDYIVKTEPAARAKLDWMEDVLTAAKQGKSYNDLNMGAERDKRRFRVLTNTLDNELKDALIGADGKKMTTTEDLKRALTILNEGRFKDIQVPPIYQKMSSNATKYGNIESYVFDDIYNRVYNNGQSITKDEIKYILQNENRIRNGRDGFMKGNETRLNKMLKLIDERVRNYSALDRKGEIADAYRYDDVGGDDIIPYMAAGNLDGFVRHGNHRIFVKRLAEDKDYKKSVRDAILRYANLDNTDGKSGKKQVMDWMQNTPEGKKIARVLYTSITAHPTLNETWSLGPQFPNVAQLRKMNNYNRLITARNQVFDLNFIENDSDLSAVIEEGLAGLYQASYDNENAFNKIYGALQTRLSRLNDEDARKFREEALQHVKEEGYMKDLSGNVRPFKWVGGSEGRRGILDILREDAAKRGDQYMAETEALIRDIAAKDEPEKETEDTAQNNPVPTEPEPEEMNEQETEPEVSADTEPKDVEEDAWGTRSKKLQIYRLASLSRAYSADDDTDDGNKYWRNVKDFFENLRDDLKKAENPKQMIKDLSKEAGVDLVELSEKILAEVELSRMAGMDISDAAEDANDALSDVYSIIKDLQ